MSSHKQKIGVGTAIAVCVNAMIGSGIFTAPAAIASSVGPAGVLAFIFVGFAVWCLALSFARLAYQFPETGSFYTYTSAWAGHAGGLFAGLLYIIGLVFAMGMLTHVCSFYLIKLFPSVSMKFLGLSVLAILMILNLMGAVLSGIGQHILLFSTLFPLISVIVVCLTHMQPLDSIVFAPYGFSHVLEATRIAIFGFLGFECAASLFGIVKNPQINVPRAVSGSVVIVAFVYALFVGSLLFAVPLSLLSDFTVPLSTVLAQVFPNHGWLVLAIHCSILSAILGTLHSMIWSASTFIHSLIHRITFIDRLLQNQSSYTQYASIVILLTGLIATVFLSFDDLNFFFSLSSLLIVTAYCLAIIALLFIKEEWQSFRNIITVLGLGTASIILYFSLQGVLAAFV
ncbi:amino acid permease [bacterium]|nr:MAG: amino acid permease [bacterium]QQR61630.1 MAG: amino acid permease [bacterium]QQR62809.1 MAG: amino acid permease [bacterium]